MTIGMGSDQKSFILDSLMDTISKSNSTCKRGETYLVLLYTPIRVMSGPMVYARKRMKWLLLLLENDDQAPPRCK